MSLRRRGVTCGTAAIALMCAGSLGAQSGRGSMHGYVGFEDVTYVEQTEGHIHAAVALRGATKHNHELYTATTDNRGLYDIPAIGAGEYILTITAPGHTTYRTEVYIPSDFECRLATMLRKKPGGSKG